MIALLAGALNAPAQSKLALDAALHQFEDGPILALDYHFVPGETAYLSCRITGYQALKRSRPNPSSSLGRSACWTPRACPSSRINPA